MLTMRRFSGALQEKHDRVERVELDRRGLTATADGVPRPRTQIAESNVTAGGAELQNRMPVPSAGGSAQGALSTNRGGTRDGNDRPPWRAAPRDVRADIWII